MNNERMTVDNGGSEEYAEIKNERPSLKRLWWSLAVGGAAAVGSFILLLTQNETEHRYDGDRLAARFHPASFADLH